MGSSSKIGRAVGAVKDRASISLAKVSKSSSLSELEVAIVKATRHDDYPADERHIMEILSLTSYSLSYIAACVTTLSRRLTNTHSWTVALKTLILIHRLLNDGDPAYEHEIFYARFINLSHFVDSRSHSLDYSSFVRTYAMYIDERLEFRMRSSLGFEDDDDDDDEHDRGGGSSVAVARVTPLRQVMSHKLFSRIEHLQHLLDTFLACRPTGKAMHNRLVLVALYPIVKESFNLYYDITDILAVLIDRFVDLDLPEAAKIYDIFCRVAKQFDDLDRFYGWCKTVAIARNSEYLEVERISRKKLELMNDFLRDKSMSWQTRRTAVDVDRSVASGKGEELKEEDMNEIKPTLVEQVKEEEVVVKPNNNAQNQQQEADLLDMGDESMSGEDHHANELALALFDDWGGHDTTTSTTVPALTYNDDWETALVESASRLASQRHTISGGYDFDMDLLNGMYELKGASMYTGSGSSVAAAGGFSVSDPFAASIAVPPPSYVQMSDMERKQQLLMQEQLMWQHYAANCMHHNEHVGFARLQQQHNYNNNTYSNNMVIGAVADPGWIMSLGHFVKS
ncbi:Putative clathrin assembly protein At1g03050 [Linum perenne]